MLSLFQRIRVTEKVYQMVQSQIRGDRLEFEKTNQNASLTANHEVALPSNQREARGHLKLSRNLESVFGTIHSLISTRQSPSSLTGIKRLASALIEVMRV